MADAHGPFVRELRRNDVAELAAPLAGHVVGHVDAFLHIATGLGHDLSHLASHLASELFLAPEHDLGGAIEDLAALRGGELAPRVERPPRRIDGGVDVGGRRLRDGGDDLAVGGIEVLERFAGRSIDPFAIDVVTEVRDRHVARVPPRRAQAYRHLASTIEEPEGEPADPEDREHDEREGDVRLALRIDVWREAGHVL